MKLKLFYRNVNYVKINRIASEIVQNVATAAKNDKKKIWFTIPRMRSQCSRTGTFRVIYHVENSNAGSPPYLIFRLVLITSVQDPRLAGEQ